MLSCRLKRPRRPAKAGYSPVACSPRSSAAASRQQIADPPGLNLALFVYSKPVLVCLALLLFSISFRLAGSLSLSRFLLFVLHLCFSLLFLPFVPPSLFHALLPSYIPPPPPSQRHLPCFSLQVSNQQLLFYSSRAVGVNQGVTNTPTASTWPSRNFIMPLTANNVFSSPRWRFLLGTLTP